MNYGTKNIIGDYNNTAGPETTTAKQTIKRVLSVDAPTKRRKHNTERQTEISASINAADAFLKHTFLPKLAAPSNTEKTGNEKKERDFYESLSQLSQHYSIELMQTQNYGYPYNIHLALYDIGKKLKNQKHWDGVHFVEEDGRYFLLSEHTYRMPYDMYYIPVMPLLKIMKDAKRHKAAQLLISVCSYLYHNADIPYYRQESSYMCWQYEMLSDMEEERKEEGDDEYLSRELNQAAWLGDRIEKMFFHTYNLQAFEKRLTGFKPNNQFEIEVKQLATLAYSLYTDYPKKSIFHHAPVQEESEDYYDEEIFQMDKRISFIANDRGDLYDSLDRWINDEFQNCSDVANPVIIKRFDGSVIPDENLDFEIKIFELIEKLTDVLINN